MEIDTHSVPCPLPVVGRLLVSKGKRRESVSYVSLTHEKIPGKNQPWTNNHLLGLVPVQGMADAGVSSRVLVLGASTMSSLPNTLFEILITC